MDLLPQSWGLNSVWRWSDFSEDVAWLTVKLEAVWSSERFSFNLKHYTCCQKSLNNLKSLLLTIPMFKTLTVLLRTAAVLYWEASLIHSGCDYILHKDVACLSKESREAKYCWAANRYLHDQHFPSWNPKVHHCHHRRLHFEKYLKF